MKNLFATGILVVMMVAALLAAGCIEEDPVQDTGQAAEEAEESDGSTGEVKVVGSSGSDETGDTTLVQETEGDETETASDEDEEDSGSEYDVECYNDEDCGEEEYGEPYCWQGDVSQPIIRHECVNPGTINSYCKKTKKEMIKQCEPDVEFCSEGECLVIAEQPCEDSDGGINYEEYGEVLDGRLHRIEDRCMDDDKTLFEAYCGDDKKGRFKQHRCDGECSNGRCVD